MSAQAGSFSSPANEAAAVTKSDSTVFAAPTRALYIGAGGDVAVTMAGPSGGAVTYPGVLGGTILPISVTQVLSTGTTVAAGNIVRMW